MKHFESFLAPQIEQYVLYRQSLGYSEKNLKSSLFSFDRYLKEQSADWDSLRPIFFLELREKIHKKPRTVNKMLSVLRGFFQFLVRRGICTENPLRHVPPLSERYFVPFVFSPVQTDQFLSAVVTGIRKTEGYFLKDLAAYMAILLLARCGMRISEPLRLLLNHYRRAEGSIYIEKTKFRKDRLIPVPKATMREIENYLVVRNSFFCDGENQFLFSGKDQKPLNENFIRRIFHRAVRDIGLYKPKEIIGNITFGSPTPHSLRHSFAINTLKAIKDRGKSPQHALPVLAAYMGHHKYQYTGAYLKVRDSEHRAGLIEFAKSQLEVI
jgi:integrase